MTDDDLRLVQGLTSLHWLDLWGTSITDTGLARLSGLTNLGYLALGSTQTLPPSDLANAIALRDKATVARTPGVGPKVAERIVTELLKLFSPPSMAVAFASPKPPIFRSMIFALTVTNSASLTPRAVNRATPFSPSPYSSSCVSISGSLDLKLLTSSPGSILMRPCPRARDRTSSTALSAVPSSPDHAASTASAIQYG